MKRSLAFGLAVAVVAGLSAIPAQAKKAPVDPNAQICELEWQASFGKVELKQTWSGAGELSREDLTIRRDIPVSSGNGAVVLSQYTSRIGGKDYPSRLIYLSLGVPYNKGRNQRLVVTMPEGEPLVLEAEYGWTLTPLSEAQLARLTEVKARLNFRFVKVDRRGAVEKVLGEGWLDLSGFADQPQAGLTQSTDHARAVLAQARTSANPPCAMASAAEMNAMDCSEAVRKWLSFDCNENWDGPLGSFGLTTTSFSWRPRPRDGVMIHLAATIGTAPTSALQGFIIDPNDGKRYGPITVMLGSQDWGANYKVNDPALRERQSIELRRGQYVAGKWLSQSGSAQFLWSEFSQLLAGDGDLQISAFDKATGTTLRTTLPWAEVLAAEEELRTGQARLRARERDPMTQCKAVVDAEYGGEDVIVT